ncbi:MAG: monooxygenase, FAD-binding protein [Myxococcaceae bacterium]|nr:monooxygenase, FAD-binding protein [Myxococcaceae bacterium]
MEHGIWRTDLGAPLNFTTNARITGPLTAEVLRAALPAVRARHPHLRARIATDAAGHPGFRHDEVPPLELTVVAGGDWVKELEREINQPFALQGPLARFTLVPTGPGEAYLLITIHHSVGDGMSGAFLMRDLLEACAQAVAGQTPRLAELAESASIDEGLPPAGRGLRAWGHHLRFISRELSVALRSGRPLKVRRDQHHYAHSRRARVIPHQLDPVFAERLLTRARAEQTTVHGALSAAMLLGTLADAQVERAGVTFGTPVNVRALLAPAIAEQLGFYISMVSYRAVVDAKVPLWDLARAVRRQLEGTIARGDQLSMLDLLPRLMGLLDSPGLEPKVLLERVERAAAATTGLTNLGRLTIASQHGPLKIEDCHFAACPSALGDFMATATSLHGRIFWNFVWADPVLTEAHAHSLVGGIVDRLKRAVA